MKSPKNRLHSVMVVGATPAGIVAANKLGELGIPVTIIDNETDLNEKLSDESYRLNSGVLFNYAHRPGLIRILRNPGIRCFLPAAIRSAKHSQQGFNIKIQRRETFVDPSHCTLCGQCVTVCPVSGVNGDKPIKINSRLSLPGRAVIDKRRQPLCQANCPLGVNAQGYIALAKAGKYRQALVLIRKDNVLPAICGRICTHPCEAACRRADVDAPLAIRDIKRFIADHESNGNASRNPSPPPHREEHIAVVGAGPAGLAAAADLVRNGFKVTVFEKEKTAGGLLRYGIGPHRLPRNILDRELEIIEAEGVRIVTNRPVALPQGLAELRKKYNAVILATGSWADRKLGVPGEDLEGVEGCLSFLAQLYRGVYRGQIDSLEENVAVIGDGNAAFDLARTLLRLGAKVTLISWFAKEQIPADAEELHASLEEGLVIRDKSQVVAFGGTDGRMQVLQVKPTRPGRKDENGIAWPEIEPESQAVELAFKRAFIAIGQTGAYGPAMAKDGLQVDSRGLICADDNVCIGADGIYAAGDAVTGAASVVMAMAGGRRAAARVMESLNDNLDGFPTEKTAVTQKTNRPEERDFSAIDDHIETRPRIIMPEIPVSQRGGNFNEVALGYDEAQFRAEAERCLQCGVCAQCLECLTACQANQALRHDEQSEEIVENVGVMIIADPEIAPGIKGDDVIRAYGPPTAKPDIHAMVLRGYAAAAKAMVLLKETGARLKGRGIALAPPDPGLSKQIRIGVFACRCNDSFGWSQQMSAYLDNLTTRPEIKHAEALMSACIPDGIAHILNTVREKGLTRVVLASCVCCPLNYVCSACTDQRSRLKVGLFSGSGISRSMVQTCNLRGEVLRLMEKDAPLAFDLFTGLMERSLGRAAKLVTFIAPERRYNFTTAVVGQSEAALSSALTLADAGLEVFLFGTEEYPLDHDPVHPNIHAFEGTAVTAVTGKIGDFQIHVRSHGADRIFSVGGVILGEKAKHIGLYRRRRDLPGNTVQAAMQKDQVLNIPHMTPGTTSISGLFLADPPGIQISKRTKGAAAAVLAAAVMPRSPRQNRDFSAVVDESRCRCCGRCLNVCPYQAVTLKKNGNGGYAAFVDEALCKGCGNCISVCPSNAADSPYRNQVYLEQTLEELLVGRERI